MQEVAAAASKGSEIIIREIVAPPMAKLPSVSSESEKHQDEKVSQPKSSMAASEQQSVNSLSEKIIGNRGFTDYDKE